MTNEGAKWTARMTGQFKGVLSRLHKDEVRPEHKELKELAAEATAALSPLVDRFQEYLDSLQGKDLGTPAQKKAIVDEIQLMMDMLNCRCECPNCGAISSIGFRIAGTKGEERFDFRHRKENGARGSCTSTTRLPKLTLRPLESPERTSDIGRHR